MRFAAPLASGFLLGVALVLLRDAHAQAPAPAGGAQNAGAPARYVGLEPGPLIANEVAPAASDIRTSRDAGITTALVAPSRGAFRGLSALIPMRDDSSAQYVVKAPVGMHMGFQDVSGRYPATLPNAFAVLGVLCDLCGLIN